MIYDRLVTFYRACDPPTLPPTLRRDSAHLYGERTVSYRRYFEAIQAGRQIDVVIQLPYVYDLPAEAYAELPDGHMYRVLQNQHTEDEDGLPVSVISLTRMEAHYDIRPDT